MERCHRRHRPRTVAERRYEHALAGYTPADALPTVDREHLVAELHHHGYRDRDIAEHTGMTTYTTARIRTRLGLRPHKGDR